MLYQCYHRLHSFIQRSTLGICWALRRPTTRLCRCSDAPGQRWAELYTYFHCKQHICICSCSFTCNPLISIHIQKCCMMLIFWAKFGHTSEYFNPFSQLGVHASSSSSDNSMLSHLSCVVETCRKPLWVLREVQVYLALKKVSGFEVRQLPNFVRLASATGALVSISCQYPVIRWVWKGWCKVLSTAARWKMDANPHWVYPSRVSLALYGSPLRRHAWLQCCMIIGDSKL